MNMRTLSVLLLLLAILSAALWYRTLIQPPEHLMTASSLRGFIPADLDLQAIDAMEFSKPHNATLRLRKTDNGWVLPALGGAPASAQHVQQFLSALAELRGEVRATTPDLWGQFGLNEEQAVQVRFFAHGEKRLHILFGQGDFRTAFVRVDGSADVYAVPGSILTQLGAYGAAWSEQFWLETTLAAIHPDDVQAVRVKTPMAEALLTRMITQDNSTASGGWTMEHIAGQKITQDRLEGILPALSRVAVYAVLEPGNAAGAALTAPAYRLDITTNAQNVTLEAMPDTDGALIKRADQSFVYRMYGPVFERLFALQKQEQQK